MRGDRAARDNRHNKDHDNLKSSLKKSSNKTKKHRVVFDESANEFFEADYIIVVRDDCGYSDEGESEECSGCGACEQRYQEPEPGALSPPEGYKDMGLFNRDGTLREQAWWETGDVLLVGERSGTVFTPQHLQLLRRLQRERMLRSTICADCDAHAALHQPLAQNDILEGQEPHHNEPEPEIAPEEQPDPVHESDSVQEVAEPLDDDILNMLGEDPNKKVYSEAIHKDIASRWNHITNNGMEKETKTELCKLYLLPENCLFLEAPKINAEIKAAVSEQVLKRDKAMEQQQNSLGQATACVGKALDFLVKSKGCKKATKFLSDTGRMMCDLFHAESMSRRYLLQFALNKSTKDIVTQTKVGKSLFGDSLHEDLKAGKAINKTGSEIKYSNNTKANKQTKPATLNSRGPPHRSRPQYTPSAGNLNKKPYTASQRWPAPQRGPAPQQWLAPQKKGGPP